MEVLLPLLSRDNNDDHVHCDDNADNHGDNESNWRSSSPSLVVMIMMIMFIVMIMMMVIVIIRVDGDPLPLLNGDNDDDHFFLNG